MRGGIAEVRAISRNLDVVNDRALSQATAGQVRAAKLQKIHVIQCYPAFKFKENLDADFNTDWARNVVDFTGYEKT